MSSCSSWSASTIVVPTWPAPMRKIFTRARLLRAVAVASASLRRVRLLVTVLGVLVAAACASAANDSVEATAAGGVQAARGRERLRRAGLRRRTRERARAPVRRRAGRPHRRRRPGPAPRRAVPRHHRRGALRRRAGPARARIPPAVRAEPALLRPVHRQRRRHACRRVPLERDAGDPGQRAAALLGARDPYGNHNGGMLAFAPNGRLFFTMGDGGAGGDPENRAQNRRSLFGKLLSLNVATKGLKIEALGLRNAWRFSFDRANGDLYIGDVGQGEIEEIDYLRAGSPGLENYGWDVYEGRVEVRGQAARARASSSSRSPRTRTTTAARSPAASSTAARRRRCAAATSTATTAAGTSGA